jgi:hypothetical protein
MKIKVETIEELVKIVSGLVRESIMFSANKQDNYWVIELTGGY